MNNADDRITTSPMYDSGAEEAVLGSLLLDGNLINICPLESTDFFRDKYRWAYDAMLALKGRREAINQITVAAELNRYGRLDVAGGADFLSGLVGQVPTTVHFPYYQNIVKRYGSLRQIVLIAESIKSQCQNKQDPADVMNDAMALLADVRISTDSQLLTPDLYAEEAWHRVSALRDKSARCVKLGIPKLDRVLGGGLFGGEYMVLAARPGMGKTTLGQQIAKSAALSGNVLLCHAEMSKSQLIDRSIASSAGWPVTRLRQGTYTDDEMNTIMESIGEIHKDRIYRYVDGRMTTDNIREIATRMQQEVSLDLIVVDYLGLLQDMPRMSSYERVSYISGSLLSICNDMDVPMLVLAQLSRDLEKRTNKRPQLSDLRDSGKIEEGADIVCFLYRADAYQDYVDIECPPGQAELSIAKHRQGAKLGAVKLQWDAKRQVYIEY